MSRVIIVSNRLPISARLQKNRYIVSSSIGGLATGVGPFHAQQDSLWIGWSGIDGAVTPTEQARLRQQFFKEHRCYPLFYSPRDLKHYYYGTCNNTLWPILHGLGETATYDQTDWSVYESVNARVAEAVVAHYSPGDTIWIHDYHMLLVAQYVREKLPDATIGFFLHIPFPAFEIFRMLPQRDSVLRAMLQNDLVGFHTYDYAQNFLDNVRRLTGYTHRLGQVMTERRLVQVDAFPLGIDYKRFAQAYKKPAIKQIVRKLRHDVGNRTMLLSIDRLDYTKGIRQRLSAFAGFLDQHPEYHNKVTLVLILAIVRPKVMELKHLKQHIDRMIGQINGTYGGINWTPVRYVVRTIDFDELTALYLAADVALITPLRDGMNLIAKEYVATRYDNRGVLVLSEMAGAAEELGEAIQINPYNAVAFTDSIYQALTMPVAEQHWRMQRMRERLERYSTERWVADFMSSLRNIKAEQQRWHAKVITPALQEVIVQQYRRSKRRLLLLDYDGTLVDFVRLPQQARPSRQLVRLLTQLSRQVNTQLVIMSGRDRQTLDRWFKNLPCALVAEHGAWIKAPDKPWQVIEPLNMDWKKEVRSLMELYVDRTAGSSIEEKQYALVWHYRGVKGQLAEFRAHQLLEALVNLTAHYNLRVIEGSAVIEVLPSSISKARLTSYWLQQQRYSFVLAAGDDRTDEDMFSALPKRAVSIKVRIEPSQAKYTVPTCQNLQVLLTEFAQSS